MVNFANRVGDYIPIVYIYTEIRIGFHQNPLPSGKLLTSKVSFADFLIMLNAALISALIILPEDVLNNPRLIRLPAYSSCLQICSLSKKLHFDV